MKDTGTIVMGGSFRTAQTSPRRGPTPSRRGRDQGQNALRLQRHDDAKYNDNARKDAFHHDCLFVGTREMNKKKEGRRLGQVFPRRVEVTILKRHGLFSNAFSRWLESSNE